MESRCGQELDWAWDEDVALPPVGAFYTPSAEVGQWPHGLSSHPHPLMGASWASLFPTSPAASAFQGGLCLEGRGKVLAFFFFFFKPLTKGMIQRERCFA